jgi:hypothetical protein
MKKPRQRADIPPRNKDNNKRRLSINVTDEEVATLLNTVTYKGSPKHKRTGACGRFREPSLGSMKRWRSRMQWRPPEAGRWRQDFH